jgi:hypothetical protein
LEAALDAIRKTWATVWSFRTFEERRIHKLDHSKVAMPLLVHTNFPDEEANGVAVTNNIFDTSGNAPGFYVNVQYGGARMAAKPGAETPTTMGSLPTRWITRCTIPTDSACAILGASPSWPSTVMPSTPAFTKKSVMRSMDDSSTFPSGWNGVGAMT